MTLTNALLAALHRAAVAMGDEDLALVCEVAAGQTDFGAAGVELTPESARAWLTAHVAEVRVVATKQMRSGLLRGLTVPWGASSVTLRDAAEIAATLPAIERDALGDLVTFSRVAIEWRCTACGAWHRLGAPCPTLTGVAA